MTIDNWARMSREELIEFVLAEYAQLEALHAEFEALKLKVERFCDWLLAQLLQYPEAKRLLKRYHKYRDCLFVFLHRTGVSSTNNVSERKLRPSVVHRKVTGCFRSA
jgi:hypothetical protein